MGLLGMGQIVLREGFLFLTYENLLDKCTGLGVPLQYIILICVIQRVPVLLNAREQESHLTSRILVSERRLTAE